MHTNPATDALLARVAACLPAMRDRAAALDRDGGFPSADLEALRAAGVLRAPLPISLGGAGLGTEPEGAAGLFALLHLLGGASMAVGRIVEGHVNAVHLICRHGTPAQRSALAEQVADGQLHAIWNTEAPPGVRLDRHGRLHGRKTGCSGVGHVTRALVTVDTDEAAGARMLVASLAPGERCGPSAASLHGMRATGSGWVELDGLAHRPGDWIGAPGDYLREPAFSAGAWRTLAVIVGGVGALVDALRTQLFDRDRHRSPAQAARIAQALIAHETAWLWTRQAGLLAEANSAPDAAITGYVALARRAVESASLDAVQLAQRSLGLASLLAGNPAERLMRDLATYLRQPALDEALDEAAAHFTDHDLPGHAFPAVAQ